MMKPGYDIKKFFGESLSDRWKFTVSHACRMETLSIMGWFHTLSL